MIKKLIILIAVISGIGTAIGDGIDPGNLVRYLGKFGGLDESSYSEHRPGIDVDEMNLRSIDPTITSAIANKMNDSRVGGGLFGGNWVDFPSMFSALGIVSPTTDQFTTYFVLDAKDDSESYWGDVDNNNAIDPNEKFHRFNLLRDDWDTMTIANINTNLFAAPVAYSDSPAINNGGGLRWLANFGKDASGAEDQTLKGNFATVADRRNQIAANLIDYCDSNSNPTTDYDDTTNPGVASVTYMGNERTPRINEVYIGVHAVATRANKAGSNYATRLVIYSVVGGELINIYGDNFGAATLTVSYSVTATITGTAAGMPAFGTKTYNLATAPNYTSINLGSNGYVSGKTETSIYDSTSTNKIGSPYPTVGVTAVTVTITEAKLTRNSDGVVIDYAKFNYTSPSATIKVATGPGSAGWEQTTFYGCFQADDPRQHLFPAEWSAGTTDVDAGALPAYGTGGASKGTPGAKNNSSVAPFAVTMTTSGKDLETGKVLATDTAVDDPSYKSTATAGPRLSTAYIRNGPMVSPWELGAIHRGVKWETINLKEYNNAAGANTSTGGGLYTASPVASKNGGDANILDQIKMTAKVKSKQKVNLTLQTDDLSGTTSYGVLSALFQKIHIGSSYASMLRLLGASNDSSDFAASGIGDRWIDTGGSDTVRTWDGSTWPSTPIFTGDGYVHDGSGKIYIWNGVSWNSPWTDTGTDITPADVKVIVADIKTRSANSSTAFKTRAGVVAQSSTLISRTGQINDRTKEEIIGKTINLTTVSSTGYFTVIIIAQSIKDVGPGIFSKDLDLSGSISNPPPLGPLGGGASEVVLNADINGDGDKTDTGIPETITKTAFGSYVQYADEIMAEQKIRADVYKDPLTGKCTIIKMEYLEE